MKLVGIPSDRVEEKWADVESKIEAALEYSQGEHTLDTIHDGLLARAMQLWLAVTDADDIVTVGVTEIHVYPSGLRICYIVLVAGSRFDDWKHMIELIGSWAREQGADTIRIHGRPGWLRKLPELGFKHVYATMDKALNNGKQRQEEIH